MGGQLSGKNYINFFQGIIGPFDAYHPRGLRGDMLAEGDPPYIPGATDIPTVGIEKLFVSL